MTYPPQQPGYGGWPQPSWQPPQQGPRRRTGLIVAIVAAIVVVAAATTIVLVIVLGGGDSDDNGESSGPPSPEGAARAAETVANGITEGSAETAANVTCQQPTDRQRRGFDLAMQYPPASAEVTGEPNVDSSGTQATVDVVVSPEGGPSQTHPYEVVHRDGGWCVQFGWEQFDQFG